MSEKVWVTPADVEEFAKKLENYNMEIMAETSKVRGRLKNLGSTWRDQEYEDFVQHFEQSMKVIQGFLQNSDKYAKHLHKKVAAANKYLQTKLR